jgi:HEAT repeat protein
LIAECSKDTVNSTYVIRALKGSDDPRVISHLETLLSGSDERREQAAFALGASNPKALTVILECLNSTDSELRNVAALELGTFLGGTVTKEPD